LKGWYIWLRNLRSLTHLCIVLSWNTAALEMYDLYSTKWHVHASSDMLWVMSCMWMRHQQMPWKSTILNAFAMCMSHITCERVMSQVTIRIRLTQPIHIRLRHESLKHHVAWLVQTVCVAWMIHTAVSFAASWLLYVMTRSYIYILIICIYIDIACMYIYIPWGHICYKCIYLECTVA